MALLKTYFIYLACVSSVYGLYEGMYCGTENCYDVLNVTRTSTKREISRSYRLLARKWHPDKAPSSQKEEFTVLFRRIATAYEIITDADTRSEYDYMLDNPDEFYYNYYRYYKRRVSPQVDVRVVILVTLTVVSLIHYYGMWTNYDTALKYLLTQHKYRSQAKDIAIKAGLLDLDKKKNRLKSKDQIKEEEETVLRKVLEQKMDIKGGHKRPEYTDFLLIRLFLLPYTLSMYVHWYGQWIWRFNINGQEYGDEEKEYIIRKNMKMSAGQWDNLEDHQRDEFMRHELWLEAKFKVWKQEREDEMKAKLADSGRAKMMRRYMKNNKNQITFGPE